MLSTPALLLEALELLLPPLLVQTLLSFSSPVGNLLSLSLRRGGAQGPTPDALCFLLCV